MFAEGVDAGCVGVGHRPDETGTWEEVSCTRDLGCEGTWPWSVHFVPFPLFYRKVDVAFLTLTFVYCKAGYYRGDPLPPFPSFINH